MNGRDELIEILHREATADRVKNDALSRTPVVKAKVEAVADAILAAGYRKPLTVENERLVIDDGLLLLDVGSCTCSPYGSSHELGCGYEYLDDLTKPLARAGYRRPRTITTAEELDALPEDSVIRTAGHGEFSPRVAVKSLRFDSGVSYWHVADADDFESTSDELDDLPATVLYEPEQP